MNNANQLFKEFDNLQQELLSLGNELPKLGFQFWSNSEPANALVIAKQLQDIYYKDGQDGRETRSYTSVVSCSELLLEKIQKINEQKQILQNLIIKIKNTQNPIFWSQAYEQLNLRPFTLNESLKLNSLSRIHLKQCHRHIPYLSSEPEKISFSWYNSGRSIKKLDRQQVLEKLLALNPESPHIQLQIEKLANIKDLFLAQIQKQAPVIRCNILYKDKQRKAMNCSLPLFYPSHFGQPLVEIIPPPTFEKQRSRALRNDSKINDEVYLKSIRVHRYKCFT